MSDSSTANETNTFKTSRRGLMAAASLFAAMIAGIVSFHFAPQAREGLESAVRALDSR